MLWGMLLGGCTTNMLDTPLNTSRVLLTKLRGGDYAHAGDVEAIEHVLRQLEQIAPPKGPVLDVGCGFGGTAHYFKTKGFEPIYGMDIDKAAIQYAASKYPDICFQHGDALAIDSTFAPNTFSLIYFFNSLYAIKDKKTLLKKLHKISQPLAVLAIFDYSIPDAPRNPKGDFSSHDFSGQKMYPVAWGSLPQELRETGWALVASEDLSQKFIAWYSQFLVHLRAQKSNLLKEFSEQDIQKVAKTFSSLLEKLTQKKLGGIVFYARKQSP